MLCLCRSARQRKLVSPVQQILASQTRRKLHNVSASARSSHLRPGRNIRPTCTTSTTVVNSRRYTAITSNARLATKKFTLSRQLQYHGTVRSDFSSMAMTMNGPLVTSITSISDLLERLINEKINCILQLMGQLQAASPNSNKKEDESMLATSPGHESSFSTSIMVITKLKAHITYILQTIKRYAQTLVNALLVAWRSGEIAVRFSPLLVLTPAAILFDGDSRTTGMDKSLKTTNKMSDWAWMYTLYTIQSLGPAFIKISQWAATRPDIFPRRFCDRLAPLQDSAFIHSWGYTKKVLIGAFGENYGDWLRICENDVIGSGSVAQVYKGSFSSDGVENHVVAVKVLHPDIHDRIERDMSLFFRVASILNALPSETIRMMNLPKVTSNFAHIMRHQLDLRNESDHLDVFRYNFSYNDNPASVGVPKVKFPRPILAEADCLVEDYEDAVPISILLKDDSEKGLELRRKLAGLLLRSFLKMVFIDNFVHSDLHQGNIQVKKTKVRIHSRFDVVAKKIVGLDSCSEYEETYTIVFLDAGIVTTLNMEDQQNLKDLFKAVIMNNGEKAGRLMVERAKFERCSQIEGGVDKFARGVSEIVNEFHDRRKQGLTLGVVRIGTLLSRVLDLCRVYGVEIDPAMSNIVMSTLVLEGLGRSLDANVNLFDIALPFVLGQGKV
jgi:aarF domain-containing kinase